MVLFAFQAKLQYIILYSAFVLIKKNKILLAYQGKLQ